MDVEGTEFAVIKALALDNGPSASLARVDQLGVEVHHRMLGDRTAEEDTRAAVIELLSARDFALVHAHDDDLVFARASLCRPG